MPFDRGVRRQTFAAFTATLGAMAMGTILGWSSPAQDMLSRGQLPFPADAHDALTYSSALGIGAVAGAIHAGAVSRAIGRRYGMMLYEMFVVSGWACLTVPAAVWTLTAGRILQGVGVGALCTIIPAYVGEISQPDVRGSLGAIFQVFVVIGILYAYAFGSFVKYVPFNVLCGVWPVIHVIGVIAIPESPYFLLSKNRDGEAKASRARLRDESAADTAKELCALKQEIRQQKSQHNTIGGVLSDKVNRKSLLIGIGCMFFQQASGINVIIFNMHYIFDNSGSKISAWTSSIVIAVIQLIMTFVTMAVIDKVGRRILLMVSAVVMSLSVAGLAGLVKYRPQAAADAMEVRVFDWLPLLFVAVFVSAFSLGFGPVPWVVAGEIYSTEIKSYGTSLATTTNWAMVFAVTFSPDYIQNVLGDRGLFVAYSVFCLLGAVFVWLFVPETKNKSLVEIQLELAGDAASTSAAAV